MSKTFSFGQGTPEVVSTPKRENSLETESKTRIVMDKKNRLWIIEEHITRSWKTLTYYEKMVEGYAQRQAEKVTAKRA